MEFKEACKKVRTEAGLSREAFADEIGVTPCAIVFWEKGETKPRRRIFANILKYYKDRGIDCSELEMSMNVQPAPHTVAQAIFNIRTQVNMTQTEFGDAIELGEISIQNWESGRFRPGPRSMKRLRSFCALYGCDYNKLKTAWDREAEFDKRRSGNKKKGNDDAK